MIARVAVIGCIVAGMRLFGQEGGIYQRVEDALAPSGQGAAGLTELKSKEFARLDQRLSSTKPTSTTDRSELLALRGAVAFLAGDMAHAVSVFQEAEKIRPLKEADCFTFSMALVKLGDDERARSLLTRLATEHSTTAIYRYWLGRLDYDERRYKEAVENLQKATAQDPKSARAWDSLGLAWDMQGNLEQARQAFETAVTLNRSQAPPSPWPPHNLGYLLFRAGEVSAAENFLRESLRYDSNIARTHYYLARVLEKKEQNAEAISEYQLSIASDPASADACYSLAQLYRRLNREGEADAMFTEFKKRKTR